MLWLAVVEKEKSRLQASLSDLSLSATQVRFMLQGLAINQSNFSFVDIEISMTTIDVRSYI